MHIEVYPNPEKQKQMLELLKFDTVMVFLDARHPDVKVPESHKNQFDLRLNFDYEFGIEDFRVLPERIEATLSFPGGHEFCVIPFSAVYLMVCHAVSRGSLFPESVPNEMLEFFFDPKMKNLPQEIKKPFKVIENQDSTQPAPEAAKKTTEAPKTDSKSPKQKPRKKGHLRLIK